jgi:hypothetical protein
MLFFLLRFEDFPITACENFITLPVFLVFIVS